VAVCLLLLSGISGRDLLAISSALAAGLLIHVLWRVISRRSAA
jgi:hypothetical protein